jgi:signal transduction histidine kinase
MGMGLRICHSIIEAHGGKIWANTDQDDGAIFFFALPAEHDCA